MKIFLKKENNGHRRNKHYYRSIATTRWDDNAYRGVIILELPAMLKEIAVMKFC